MGEKRSEFVFLQRPVQQPEFDRNIVKPARSEAAIEMSQAGNDDPDDRHLDVGPALIEHEKIEARSPGDVDAGIYLLARRVEKTRLPAGAWLHRAARRQEGIVLQAQWSDAVEARFLAGSASHQADRQELVQLRQRTQHGNAGIEVRAGAELDVFLSVLHPVQYRHIGGKAEVAGDVEHP